jgi:outer membrane protein assembly factor BamB
MARWTASSATLYVSANGGLFAFDGKSGQRLWALPNKQMLSGDPVVAEGAIYYTTSRYLAAPDENTQPKDLPGLHAVKLKVGAPASAPAK